MNGSIGFPETSGQSFYNNLGGFIGRVQSSTATFYDCSVNVYIRASQDAAGFVGVNQATLYFYNCATYINESTSTACRASYVGWQTGTSYLTNCTADGAYTSEGSSVAGAFLGDAGSGGKLVNCTNYVSGVDCPAKNNADSLQVENVTCNGVK